VAQAPEEVLAVLVRQPLADLGALPGHAQPATLRPPDQPAVEDERLPRAARRREGRVRRPVALMVGDELEPAADPDPERRWDGAHLCTNAT